MPPANKSSQSPDSKAPDSKSSGRTTKVHSKDRDMGDALRSAWQNAVEEKVPADMLDLLSKLD